MNFLETIFDSLQKSANSPVLGEVRDGRIVSVSGGELLELIEQTRMFFVDRGLKRGDRCALIAPNGIRWAALGACGCGKRKWPSIPRWARLGGGPARVALFSFTQRAYSYST